MATAREVRCWRRTALNALGYLLFFLAITLAVYYIVHGVAKRLTTPESVFSYSQGTYPAEPPSLCPGETFTYEYGRTINRVPAIAMTVGSWWHKGLEATLLADDAPEFLVWLTEGDSVFLAEKTVPDELPAGLYEYRVAGQVFGTAASGYYVAVDVLNCGWQGVEP